MAFRLLYDKNNEIGAYCTLTNSFCLVSTPLHNFNSFERTMTAELGGIIPVIPTSIAGCQVIGFMVAGNRNGLLVSHSTTDQELLHLRNSLPDAVKVRRIEERANALGNVISCNDYVALVASHVENETIEIIEDVLQVEVVRHAIPSGQNVGSYCVFNNQGGLLHPCVCTNDQEELSSLLQVPLVRGTVNCGSRNIRAGLVANDFVAACGFNTTSIELSLIESVFCLNGNTNKLIDHIKAPLIESGAVMIN